jgi:hypothetical protein
MSDVLFAISQFLQMSKKAENLTTEVAELTERSFQELVQTAPVCNLPSLPIACPNQLVRHNLLDGASLVVEQHQG